MKLNKSQAQLKDRKEFAQISEESIKEKRIVSIQPTTRYVANRPALFPNHSDKIYPDVDYRTGKPILGFIEEAGNVIGIPPEEYTRFGIDLVSKEGIERIKLRPINLPHRGRKFDLSSLDDEYDYRILQTCTDFIAKDIDSQTRNTRFYIDDPVLQSKNRNVKNKSIHKAMTILYGFSNRELIDYLALYDRNTQGINPEVAESILTEQVKINPEKFLSFIENKDYTTYRVLILQAVEVRVLTKVNTLYYFGEVVIGSTEEETIKFLKSPKNQELYLRIKTNVENAMNLL